MARVITPYWRFKDGDAYKLLDAVQEDLLRKWRMHHPGSTTYWPVIREARPSDFKLEKWGFALGGKGEWTACIEYKPSTAMVALCGFTLLSPVRDLEANIVVGGRPTHVSLSVLNVPYAVAQLVKASDIEGVGKGFFMPEGYMADYVFAANNTSLVVYLRSSTQSYVEVAPIAYIAELDEDGTNAD